MKRQERAKEKIRIVTLQGTPRSSAQLGRTEGFQEVLSSHKNWKMLDCQSGEFTQAKGQEVMEGFLQKYKDIDVVISENDNMTFGAVEAIETAGKTCGPKGDIIIISFDAVKNALKLVEEGLIAADVESNPNQGGDTRTGSIPVTSIKKTPIVRSFQTVDKVRGVSLGFFSLKTPSNPISRPLTATFVVE